MISTRKPNAARANRHALFRRLVAAIVARYGATTERSDYRTEHTLQTPHGPLTLYLTHNGGTDMLSVHGYFADGVPGSASKKWNHYWSAKSATAVRYGAAYFDQLLTDVMIGGR